MHRALPDAMIFRPASRCGLMLITTCLCACGSGIYSRYESHSQQVSDGGSGEEWEHGGAPPADGGVDAGVDAGLQRLSTDEIFRRLTPTCVGCHGAGSSLPSFRSLGTFEDLVAFNPSAVIAGSPASSELVALLEGTSTSGRQMPPTTCFAELARRGQTEVSMAQIRDWISTLQPRAPVMPMVDSWERTLGFLDFSQPDMTVAEIMQNAPHYSYVFGGLAQHQAAFRSANPQINIGRYTVGFLDDHNGRPNSYPGGHAGDTPQRRARTLQWWNSEVDGTGHPDWVLYRCDGVTPAYWLYDDGEELPNMPLDISNPDVADWQLRNSEEPGFSSLFADLVYLENYSRGCGIWKDGQWVQRFTGQRVDPAYAQAVLNWAARIKTGLHNRPSPRGFVPNCPLYPSYPAEAIASLIESIDGLVDEEGFTGYGASRATVSGDVWVNKVRNMVTAQQHGVAFYLMNYVSNVPPPAEELEWVLASFLMGKGHRAYLLMTLNPPLGDYGPHWPHLPEYDENVGHPCSPMVQAQGAYQRDYSHGLAVVNPSRTARITFGLPPGSFGDLTGAPVTSPLVLQPLTGRVLLSSATRCP